jgi:ketosteroid isomerase-like protein
MSEENVEIVRRLYESKGSEFYELLDPHVVFINYASAPETRPYVGHDGVREWAAGFRATFGDYEVHVTEIIDAGGDRVVAVGRVTGAGTASGVPIEREVTTVYMLLNGKIVKGQGFETRAEALEAAGVKE